MLNCGPWTSSSGIAWDLVRNEKHGAPAQIHGAGGVATTFVSTSPPDGSQARQSVKTTVSGPSEHVQWALLLTLNTRKSSKSKTKITGFGLWNSTAVSILDPPDTFLCVWSYKKMLLASPGPSGDMQEPDYTMVSLQEDLGSPSSVILQTLRYSFEQHASECILGPT